MDQLHSSELLKATLKALYTVAGRRTSDKFADESIGATIKTLESKFEFLKHVRINEEEPTDEAFNVNISSTVDSIDPARIGRAIESIIRVVYEDLDEEAGLFFITEFKKYVGERVVTEIMKYQIDLDQLQFEQHFAYRRKKQKEGAKDGRGSAVNQLGYTWNNVASWTHEPGTTYCVLYDESGKELDRLDLDRIIQSYVSRLSGYAGKDPSELEIELYEKEYELLEMMYSRDMDAETAAALLHITTDQLNDIIRKLAHMEMIHYASYDTLELTDSALNYISKKQEKKKNV